MSKRRKQGKSRNWTNRQNRDVYVRMARNTGMRARSAFKLEQIDQKYSLIKSGSRIVDLGAAPGSWSQYALNRLHGRGTIVAVDLLEMKELPGVSFILGDFTDLLIQQQILHCLDDTQFDLVLSDMAPNITGIRATDQARASELQCAVLEFSQKALAPGGNLVTKLFEGENSMEIRDKFQRNFAAVQMIKPDASRRESKEMYLLARKYTPGK